MTECIALASDCAQLCRLSASMQARGNTAAATLGAICADLCDNCARECSRHALAPCQRCAEACRYCAEQWRELPKENPPSGNVWGRRNGAAPH